jgi:hypothetical protein
MQWIWFLRITRVVRVNRFLGKTDQRSGRVENQVCFGLMYNYFTQTMRMIEHQEFGRDHCLVD